MPWTARRLRTVIAALAVPTIAGAVLAVAAMTSASVGADEVVGHPGLFPVPAGYSDAVGIGVDSVSAGLPVCPAVDLCVAAGDVRKSASEVDPFIWTSSEPVSGGWAYAVLPMGAAVSGHVASVSCASATLCVASGTVSVPAANGVGVDTRNVTWTSATPSVRDSWTLADAAAPAVTGLDSSSALSPAGTTVSDPVCAGTACFAVGRSTDAAGEPRTALWTSSDGATWTLGTLPMPAGYDYLRTDAGTGSRPAQCFGSGASAICLISGRVITATGEGSYGLWASRTPADATSWRFVSLELPTVGASIGAGALAGRASCQSGYCFYANTGPGTANPYGDSYLWVTATPTDGSTWSLIRTPAVTPPAQQQPPVPQSLPPTSPSTVAPVVHPVTVLPPVPVSRATVRQVRGGKTKLAWVRPAASATRPRTGFRVYVNNKLIKTLTATSMTLTKQRRGTTYAVKIVTYNRVGSAAKRLTYRRTLK